MANVGANALLVVRQNVPPQIQDLEAEAVKLVSRLHEIQEELATLRTILLLMPPESVSQPVLQESAGNGTEHKQRTARGAGNDA